MLASLVLRLWAARAAILDRIAAVSWPCDEFLQERITILDDREKSLEGLKKDPQSCAKSSDGPYAKEQQEDPA